MVFRFTDRRPQGVLIDMALEATFQDGRKIQSMYATVGGQRDPLGRVCMRRVLVYREGVAGRWLSSEGISFEGVQRTPENLVRSVGRAEPVAETYVLPAV